MLSTALRFSKFTGIALLSAALAACGGSDADSAANEAAGKSMDQVTEAVSGAGEMAKDVVESAGSAAKAAQGAAEEAAEGALENAGAVAAAVTDGVAAVAAAGPDLAAGEKTYGRFCFSCHAAGVAGAPKLGSEEDWAPRAAKGLDMLVASTIKGIAPGMPARGLCMNCSDEDLRNTVAWMLAQQ